MDDCPRRPINKQRTFDVNQRVSSLLREDVQWDMDKLQFFFPENEAIRIRNIQIGRVEDKDIWAYSANGSYTVKSGYKLATKLKETEEVQSMSLRPEVLELNVISGR